MQQEHKNRLQTKLTFLKKHLDISDELLEHLQKTGTLTADHVITIQDTKRRDRTSVAYDLINILVKRGPRAFDSFISALNSCNQEKVITALGGRVAPIVFKFRTERSTPNDPFDETKLIHDFNFSAVRQSDPFFKTIISTGSRYYAIRKNQRVRVILISNERRSRRSLDRMDWQALFMAPNFHLRSTTGLQSQEKWHDKSAEDIRNLMRNEADNENPKLDGVDVYMMVILGEGNDKYLYGADGAKVDIENDIISAFNETSATKLNGIPKIFVIGTIENVKEDGPSPDQVQPMDTSPPVLSESSVGERCPEDIELMEREATEASGSSTVASGGCDVSMIPKVKYLEREHSEPSYDVVDTIVLPKPMKKLETKCQEDMLILHTTYKDTNEAFKLSRSENHDSGTVLTRTFIKEVADNAHYDDMLHLLSQVRKNVNEKLGREACRLENRKFNKKLYLLPGYYPEGKPLTETI